MAQAKIITGANAKGGAGKTLSVILLGTELAFRGMKVLIIDTDSEKNISSWFDRCVENGTPVTDIAHEYAGTSNKLLDVLKANVELYDYILIDTPGRLEKFQQTAFELTDLIIIPVQACQSDIKGMVTLISTLLEIEEAEQIEIRKLVFNTRITMQDRHINEYKSIGNFINELKEDDSTIEHSSVELMQRNPYRKVYSGFTSLRNLPDADKDSVLKAIEEASNFTDAVLKYLEEGAENE
ncbi:ParA family protein [Ochrobactrum sp. MR28]|nr:ParA family protein [Ochrobactrum sp. MR28]MBX8818607.1 ParA family protein [Ochrobactrum sp. MR31]